MKILFAIFAFSMTNSLMLVQENHDYSKCFEDLAVLGTEVAELIKSATEKDIAALIKESLEIA